MRAFLAFNLDKDSILKIKDLQNKFKDSNNLNLKYIKEEQFHITTFFLGEINNKEEIIEHIQKLSFPKNLSFNIEKLKFFPNNNNANVITLGIDNFSFLREFIETQDKLLEKINFKRDKNWSPHITIARSKEKFKSIEFNFEPFNININSFIFYESILNEKGALYKPLYIKNLT